MGFLDQNLADVPEIKPVDDGTYELEVTYADVRESKNEELPDDAQNIFVSYQIVGEPTAENVLQYMSLPNSGDDDRGKMRKLNRIREWCDWLGVSYDWDTVEMDGRQRITEAENLRGNAVLRYRSDPTYGDSNEIVQYQTS